MATKTVYVQVQEYFVPPIIKNFSQKLYFLVSTLFFNYNEEGYHNRVDVKIHGFSDKERRFFLEMLREFSNDYEDSNIFDNCVIIEGFSYSTIQSLIAMLPEDLKKLLADHILLSIISEGNDYKEFYSNLKYTITNYSSYLELLPFNSKNALEFLEFLKGKESLFIDEWYSKAEQEELKLQYGI